MKYAPLVISLPIADRRRAFEFYGNALGLETIGEVADDGVPEPLQFVINEGLNLMLVPSGGFGWTIGGRAVAAGSHECLLAISTVTPTDTDDLIDSAVAAGAEVVTPPGSQPWGYAGAFSDPDGHIWMVRSETDADAA